LPQSFSASRKEPEPRDGKKIIFPLVVKDIEDRAIMGKKRYSTYLRAHNGRDALVDAYQEALDMVMYLRQAIEERGWRPNY